MIFLINQLPLLIIACLFLNRIYIQWTQSGAIDFKGLFRHFFLKPSLIILALSFISTIFFSFIGYWIFPLIRYLTANIIGLFLATAGLTFVFGLFAQKKQTMFTLLNYGISILMMTFMMSFIAQDHYYYDFYEEPYFILIISSTLVALAIGLICALCLFVGSKIVYLLAKKRRHTANKSGLFSKHQQKIHKTSKDMKEHYLAQGLDNQEIEYFREQMAQAKSQIQSITQEFPQTAKLRAIETRHNTIRVSQSFFKDIVNQPKRLSDASQFLYKFLPSLQDLIAKYNEINQHIAKNKQTYQILDKTALTIDQVCQQITDEYILFHQDTFNELNDEIELAHRNIERRQHQENLDQSVDDLLDQLIQDEQDTDSGGEMNE
ncbi:5-bromo-4-chloroindolyl phosphate hydrolysis family protein [Ignavigranum ruoffiae]|uniref:5-bromo-4-chloroindolyl phosphate hydrolysis family protein n=1 Tax=Ignavigranum ruoffiae TaxID=89093 RepID=UPI0024AD2A59|nr:5-bromo-4-chloroindolyl phosphate hydrolysis family protein [Ignavigranum ruoffiae]